MLKRAPHLLQLALLSPQLFDAGDRQRLDLGARPLAILPEGQELADLLDGKGGGSCAG
jgi:hypothetical protein